MIQAEHLSKTYVLKEKSHLFGKKKVRQISAVRDISLEIPKGKITGVLGSTEPEKLPRSGCWHL